METKKIKPTKDPRNPNHPWIVRWSGDTCHGQRKRFYESFKTEAEADLFAAQKNKEFAEGAKRDIPGKITLGSYFELFLRIRKQELRLSTILTYQSTIERLLEYFGAKTYLQDITGGDASLFIAEQRSKAVIHRGKSVPLSDATREQIKRNCKTIFQTAVDEYEYLDKNPFKNIKLRKVTTKRWHRVTIKEYFALLDATSSLRERAAYSLLYTAGLRLSEAYSLLWSDIDFENGRVLISNRDGTADIPPFEIKDHEARRIPLPAHTIDLLTKLQAQGPVGVPFVLLTAERYEIVKAKWQQLRKAGEPWRNCWLVNNVLRNFKAHCHKAGIKAVAKLTVHTLRKCAGQNWADDNPLHIVKAWMGHSDIKTTAEFYLQVETEDETKGRDKLQQKLEPIRELARHTPQD